VAGSDLSLFSRSSDLDNRRTGVGEVWMLWLSAVIDTVDVVLHLASASTFQP